MNRLVSAAVVAWSLLLVGACKPKAGADGGVDGGPVADLGGGDAGPTGPGADFCRAYVPAWCAGNLGCCSQAAQKYGSMAECVDGELAACFQRWTGSAFTSGHATFDAAAGSALVAATMGATSPCGVPSMRLGSARLSHGNQPSGTVCNALGDDTSPQSSCADGTVCAIDPGSGGTSASCQAPHVMDADCGDGVPCVPGLFCDFAVSIMHPLCHSKLAAGSACALPEECASGACDGTSGMCVAATADDAFCRGPTGSGV